MDLQWYYSLSWTEYLFICLLFLANLFYAIRVIRLSKKLPNKQPSLRLFIKMPLRIAYFVLIIIAIIGPSFGYGKKFVQAVGKDIYILIDISKSMNATDISPSRLEKVKYEVKNLINTFAHDRIGLIIFAYEAFMQCPLTYDKSALELFLQNINTQSLTNGSTDFQQALQLALSKHQSPQKTLTDFKAKLVILISDGEDFGEKTQAIIPDYQKLGIRIFTIGVGTEQGSRIPLRGGYQLDNQGNPAYTRVNFTLLESIAQKTGGQFFEINREKNQIPQLIKTIEDIKGQRLDIRTVDVSFNKFEYFIWIALAFICLDVIFIVKIIKV